MNPKLETLIAKKKAKQEKERAEAFFKRIHVMKGDQGPKGDKPVFGVDFLLPEEIEKIKSDLLKESTPKFGKDYFTNEDIENFLKICTPVKGIHYNDGADGKMPKHKWEGTKLFLELKPGTWGAGIDLKGIPGNSVKGEDGKDGQPPEHQIDGYKIRFRQNDGKWGKWIDFGVLVQLLIPRYGGGSSGTSGASATTFLELTDTPNTYAGQALKVIQVNAGETALEFVALAGGGDALTANPLSQFAATTSLQLKGVISDETGSGALVFATSPTLVTPVLGEASGTGLTLSGLTASEMVITDGTKKLVSAAVATYPSLTELTYVKGVTSAIQTQLNAKLDDSQATAFGLSLLDDANEAAGRTTLGLIAGGAGDIWVEKAGDTMSGALAMGTNKITGLGDPTADQDAATKIYVDGVAQGLSIKESVQVATAAALPTNTYSNGASGVGATLTAVATGTLTVDGVAVALNDRVLVKDEVTAANNGIYKCTVAGAIGVAYVLTRSVNCDQAADIPGAFTFVENGTVNDAAGFVVADAGPFTMGTTAINWTQFSGAGQITAGNALTKTGNTLDVAVDNSSIEVSGDALRVKASGVTSAMLAGSIDATKIADGSVTSTEFQFISTLSSNAQTQIDAKQPLDSDLTTIAGLTATTDNFIQSKASAWASRTPTQVTADLIAMVGDSGSGGTKGLVPAPSAGDAAANKFLKADGTWAAGAAGSVATDAIWDAKGDLAGGTGANTAARLAVGTNGQVLTADSAETTGMKWATVAGSGDVSKVGTPVNNQVGVWTGDGTLEGDASLTFDTTTDTLSVAASGKVAMGAVNIIDDTAGTTTLSNIDAIDATTEATIEAAIDTLANLTSVQGLTVTLADAGADAILGWDDSADAYENLTQAEVLAVIGDSSTTAKGVVELATDAEMTTGTDTTRAITPANAKVELDKKLALTGGTMTGNITLAENTSIALDPAGSADGKYTGTTVTGTGGATIAFGDLVTLDKDDSRWELVDISVAAAATGDARGLLGMAVTSSTDGAAITVLLNGIIRADANFPALTIGAEVFASTTGDITSTQPTTVDYVIRRVGAALTADEIYFNPSYLWYTHT